MNKKLIELEYGIAKAYSDEDDVRAMQQIVAAMGYWIKDSDLKTAYRRWSEDSYAIGWYQLPASVERIELILRDMIQKKLLTEVAK